MNIVLSEQVKDLPLVPVDILFSVMGQPAYGGNAHFVHAYEGTHVKGVLVAFPVENRIVVSGLKTYLKYRVQHPLFTPSAPVSALHRLLESLHPQLIFPAVSVPTYRG